MITIKVNDQIIEIAKDFNILQLLQQLESPQDGIAVAINNSIVLKQHWSTRTLLDQDSVLIIKATQGG